MRLTKTAADAQKNLDISEKLVPDISGLTEHKTVTHFQIQEIQRGWKNF
jgi:hypothetical protein